MQALARSLFFEDVARQLQASVLLHPTDPALAGCIFNCTEYYTYVTHGIGYGCNFVVRFKAESDEEAVNVGTKLEQMVARFAVMQQTRALVAGESADVATPLDWKVPGGQEPSGAVFVQDPVLTYPDACLLQVLPLRPADYAACKSVRLADWVSLLKTVDPLLILDLSQRDWVAILGDAFEQLRLTSPARVVIGDVTMAIELSNATRNVDIMLTGKSIGACLRTLRSAFDKNPLPSGTSALWESEDGARFSVDFLSERNGERICTETAHVHVYDLSFFDSTGVEVQLSSEERLRWAVVPERELKEQGWVRGMAVAVFAPPEMLADMHARTGASLQQRLAQGPFDPEEVPLVMSWDLGVRWRSGFYAFTLPTQPVGTAFSPSLLVPEVADEQGQGPPPRLRLIWPGYQRLLDGRASVGDDGQYTHPR